MKVNQKARILSYDIIRILAISMVLMIHVSAQFVMNYPALSIDFAWGNFFDSISRAAVPLFVMLSGALMLNEDRIISKSKMAAYIKGIATLLVFWSFLYAIRYSLAEPLMNGSSISWRGIFRSFLLGYGHLWFLYMILGLYLITPILRLFVRRENNRYVLYFIILSIIFKFSVPSIAFILNCVGLSGSLLKDFVDKFNMDFVSIYVSYYLTGWYIANCPIKKHHRVFLYMLGIISVAITIGCTSVLCTDNPGGHVLFYDIGNINVYLYGVALFIAIFYAFYDVQLKSAHLKTAIIKASTMSFGVYVVHIFVLRHLTSGFFAGAPGFCIPLIWMAVILISYAITWIASKIPHVNKLFKC